MRGYKLLLTTGYKRKFGIRLFFESRDLWVGVYAPRTVTHTHDVYVCVLPTLPIHFWWTRGRTLDEILADRRA